MKRKVAKMILYECCENYCQGFIKCVNKEKGEINGLAYMGK